MRGSSSARRHAPSAPTAVLPTSARMRSARAAHLAPSPPDRGAIRADSAKSGDTREPAVRPAAGLELPNTRIGLGPPLLDDGRRLLNRLPTVDVKPVQLGGRGKQQQSFANGVELKLFVDVVADDVGAARIAGQRHTMLPRNASARHRVRRFQLGYRPQGFADSRRRRQCRPECRRRHEARLGRRSTDRVSTSSDSHSWCLAALALAATSSRPQPSRPSYW